MRVWLALPSLLLAAAAPWDGAAVRWDGTEPSPGESQLIRRSAQLRSIPDDPPCLFVPGFGVGESEVLLAG